MAFGQCGTFGEGAFGVCAGVAVAPGPIALTAIAWTKTTSGGLLDFADIAIDQDAGGFANGAYGIVYNASDINKRAVGFVELSAAGVLSNIETKVELTINASGALSITQQ